ncbi:protein decapping 5-like [Pyrus ussuriensis x Pyrus communis]|uniref:Protein decapping 5-like n=1 Tax=Pyrus ussuriensis x Pyrus communis TaxID=2448454 RepID=A0A5N5FMZ1_9ROSA|nr:protein decapping 5-like [Pyrus ussuriensis x Pyrus communis]
MHFIMECAMGGQGSPKSSPRHRGGGGRSQVKVADGVVVNTEVVTAMLDEAAAEAIISLTAPPSKLQALFLTLVYKWDEPHNCWCLK